MTTGTRLDGMVRDRIREVAVEHPDWSAASVLRELERTGVPGRPNVRTVQRFLRELAGDPLDRWSMAECEPEDIPLVLDVVAETAGMAYPTRAGAEWIIRLRRAYPELGGHPRLLFHLAAIAARGDVAGIQEWLTFTPWRDGGARYAEAFVGGRANSFRSPGGMSYPDSTWAIVEQYAKERNRRDER